MRMFGKTRQMVDGATSDGYCIICVRPSIYLIMAPNSKKPMRRLLLNLALALSKPSIRFGPG